MASNIVNYRGCLKIRNPYTVIPYLIRNPGEERGLDTDSNRHDIFKRPLERNALSGYRVLDVTDRKGLLCARLLADMGTDVIRIEPPDRETGLNYLNAGKRCITLNLETAPGRDIFKQLVDTADVLIESYQPGFLRKLKLDYPNLSNLNPRLIMASVTDFGQTGPYRYHKSCALVASALGGQMSVCGEPGKPPLKPYGDQTYYTASIYGAIGIMLALWSRRTSGKRQHIDLSIQDCVATTLDHILVRYFHENTVSTRQGSQHWNNAFRIFPCKDGYILLSLFQHWETLVEWLDSEGKANDLTDKKWLNRETREQNIDHIVAILEKWTRTHTATELVEQGQLMRFSWAKVTTIPELLNNPHLQERSFFIEAEDAESGKKFRLPGAPFKMSASPLHPSTRIPRHGEHTREILSKELGLSEREIEALAEKGVI